MDLSVIFSIVLLIVFTAVGVKVIMVPLIENFFPRFLGTIGATKGVIKKMHEKNWLFVFIAFIIFPLLYSFGFFQEKIIIPEEKTNYYLQGIVVIFVAVFGAYCGSVLSVFSRYYKILMARISFAFLFFAMMGIILLIEKLFVGILDNSIIPGRIIVATVLTFSSTLAACFFRRILFKDFEYSKPLEVKIEKD